MHAALNANVLLARLVAEFPGCLIEQEGDEYVVRRGTLAWRTAIDTPHIERTLRECRVWFQFR